MANTSPFMEKFKAQNAPLGGTAPAVVPVAPVATAPAPTAEPVAKPKILELAEKDLLSMIEKIQSNLDSLKTQKSESVDSLELLKLSCSKVLREATHKVLDLEKTVEDMRALAHELELSQKGMETAKKTIEERSAAFRRERDAFLKMRSMTEKEFYELVNAVNDQK